MRLFYLITITLIHLIKGQEDDLVFIVIGDWGDSFYWEENSGQSNVSRAMNEWAASHNPRFILSTGDNFYPDGVRSVNDVWFEDKWERIYTGEHIRDLQWRMSLGNHDYEPDEDRSGPNDGGNEMFQVYRTDIDEKWYLPSLWYKFTESSPAGDVDFFVLDTEAIRDEFNNYTRQLEWIENELQASTAPVKLVVGHLTIYTLGDRAPGVGVMQDIIEPILLANDVDAYICGHDHALQHFVHTNGTGHDYIISGAGGRGLHEESLIWRRIFEENGFYTQFASEYGFAVISINSTTMHVDYIDQYGVTVFDSTRTLGQNQK